MMSCDQHDYIELVCVYRYQVELVLKTGEVLQGEALDTAYNDERQSCLCLKQGDETRLVVLDNVASMSACEPNPHFSEISFV